MDFKKVSGFLGQQLRALGEMKDLIAHEQKHPGHKVSAEEVQAFADYVATMERASRAGKTLADFYAAGSGKAEPSKDTTSKSAEEADAEPEALEEVDTSAPVDPKEEKARLKNQKEGTKIIKDIQKLVKGAQATNAAIAAEKAKAEKTETEDEDDDLDFLN